MRWAGKDIGLALFNRLGSSRIRAVVAVLSAVTWLTACAQSGTAPRHIAGNGHVASPFGDYLAGRYARSQNDLSAAAKYYLRALDEDPTNASLLRRSFALAVQDGLFDKAVPLARRMVETKPANSIASLLVVLDDVKRGAYKRALARLDDAPSSGFNALLGPVLKAWIAAGQSRYEAALDTLNALDEEVSFHSFRDFHQALIADLAGRNDEAEAAYRAALASGRGAVHVLINFGRFLERTGRGADAERLYRDYVQKYPGNPVVVSELSRLEGQVPPARLVNTPAEGVSEALYGTAQALAQENAWPAAIIYLRIATFLRPRFPDAYYLLGNIKGSLGEYENALAEFRRIPQDAPISRSAKLQIALVLNRLDRPDEAMALLDKLIATRPKDVQALTTMADVLREREQFRQASDYYSRALAAVNKIAPRHWLLYYARGITYERIKNWDKAEKDFLKALELSPEQPLVLNYLGYSWVEQGSHVKRARDMIERAVALRPNDGYIVDSLGWALYRLGDFKGAANTLERAVLLRPEDPTINDHLGDAYWRVGRRLEARFQWRHALALGPEEDSIAAIEAKLRSGPVTADNGER